MTLHTCSDPRSHFESWRSSPVDGFAKNWRAVHFRLGAIVSLTVGRRQHVLYHDMFISTKPASLPPAMHLPTLPAHLPTSLPPPRLIPDDDMFISPPADLSARPLVGPLMASCGRVKQSNWGRFCSKVHSAPSMQRLQSKEGCIIGASAQSYQ